MDTKTLKKIMRGLKTLYIKLEEEAIKKGIFPGTREWDKLQSKAREQYLAKAGYSLNDYKDAKGKLEELTSVVLKGDKGDAHTDDEITELIKPLIPEPIVPKDGKDGETPSDKRLKKLMVPLMKEPKHGITPSDERLVNLMEPLIPSFDAEVGFLEDKIDRLKIPKELDAEKLSADILKQAETFFHDNFSDNFEENINIFGMPDFRKLAMGLQGEIDRANDLSISHAWTGQQYFSQATLTDGATISWNLDTQQAAKVTLGGSRTIAAPTNIKAGGTYTLIVIQDGTGSRTLTWNAVFKWPSGAAPTLTTTAAAVDIITFISDGTSLFGVAQADFS